MKVVSLLIIISFLLPRFCFSESIEVFMEMTLEELLQVQVSQSVTLTGTDRRKLPAAVIHISHEDINRTGARDLDELLKAYVPGLQTMMKINGGDPLGIRGIISDRNNKFLILVNGRVMNEKTQWGAISERALSMLGDIQYINVIRGPGSVLYGPGALAGVINIVTHTGKSAEGGRVQIREGFIEEFSSVEIQYGYIFDNGSNLYGYYGVDDYRGADSKDAPDFFGHSFSSQNGDVVAGDAIPNDLSNDNKSYRNGLRHKAHIQYQYNNLEMFLRYTQGGKQQSIQKSVVGAANPWVYNNRSYGYQQLTLVVDYQHDWSERFYVETRLSYDALDSELQRGGASPLNYREDEVYGRVMGHLLPNENHQLAFGLEYSREQFANQSPGYPDSAVFITRLGRDPERWDSDSVSLLGEYQWEINPAFTTFLGVRVDCNDYTTDLWSGRSALVYTPTDKDAVKFIYNHSVRRMDEAYLRASELSDADVGEFEELDNIELRYEKDFSRGVWGGFSAFYVDYDIIAFNGTLRTTLPLGNSEFYGLEVEFVFKTDRYKLFVAHSYVKHLDFTSETEGQVNNVTASDLGYGDDLANWNNHQTTLNGFYTFNEVWSLDSSFVVLWGLPGGEDLADYNRETDSQINLPLRDEEFNDSWDKSAYLNVGLAFKAFEGLTVRLDAYNVLGWLDEDYNKVNEFQRSDHYQNQAASLGVSLRYRF